MAYGAMLLATDWVYNLRVYDLFASLALVIIVVLVLVHTTNPFTIGPSSTRAYPPFTTCRFTTMGY
jgi:hypothetical protein